MEAAFEQAGHPLLCIPARPGGRGACGPVCAGGLPGGALGLCHRVPFGDAQNGGVRVCPRGDRRPGKTTPTCGGSPGPPGGRSFSRHPGASARSLQRRTAGPWRSSHGLRRRLVGPLERFAARTKDAHRGGACPGGVPAAPTPTAWRRALPAYCLALEKVGEDALAQKQLRVWDLLMEILDQMRAILGDKPVTRERFFPAAAGGHRRGGRVGDPPDGGPGDLRAPRSRCASPPPGRAFLLGAVQGGIPPGAARPGGVFSDGERRETHRPGAAPGRPPGAAGHGGAVPGLFGGLRPLGAAVRLLAPVRRRGETRSPGSWVNALEGIFPKCGPCGTCRRSNFANSREAAFSRMAARFTAGDGEAGAFRLLFEGDPEYRGRLEALERAAGQRPQADGGRRPGPGGSTGSAPSSLPPRSRCSTSAGSSTSAGTACGPGERRPAEDGLCSSTAR